MEKNEGASGIPALTVLFSWLLANDLINAILAEAGLELGSSVRFYSYPEQGNEAVWEGLDLSLQQWFPIVGERFWLFCFVLFLVLFFLVQRMDL